MDILLTVKEQDREKNLFAPREAKYPLPTEKIDLWIYVPETKEGEYVIQVPLSC